MRGRDPDGGPDLASARPAVVVGRPPSAGLGRVLRAAFGDRLGWVLGLAGFFAAVSDKAVYALLLFAVAVLVVRDAVRDARGVPPPASVPLLGPAPSGRRARWRALAGAGTLLLYATVVGAFTRYSWPATVAVLVPAVAGLAVGWRGPLRPAPCPDPPHPAGVRAWVMLFVAAGLWELSALLQQPTLRQPSAAHPTVSTLMDTVLATHLGRTAVLMVWLAVGWFLLRRAPAAPRGAGP